MCIRDSMWVVPMREYNEDPVFTSLVSPTTFAARRRTIYVFFDRCTHGAAPNAATGCVERVALGGAGGGRQAELWGGRQWLVLKGVSERRDPELIGIDVSRTFAFSDGLS